MYALWEKYTVELWKKDIWIICILTFFYMHFTGMLWIRLYKARWNKSVMEKLVKKSTGWAAKVTVILYVFQVRKEYL